MRLSIDPGIGGTGWALWDEDSWHLAEPPTQTGIFTGRSSQSWEQKIAYIVFGLRGVVPLNLSHTYIEYPAYFGTASGDMVARRGDLVKLSYCVGFIAGSMPGTVTLIPVNKWKGQLPKDIVARRIQKILGANACREFKSHVWDAVGVGLYAKGCFR